jgi:hypothetical protein
MLVVTPLLFRVLIVMLIHYSRLLSGASYFLLLLGGVPYLMKEIIGIYPFLNFMFNFYRAYHSTGKIRIAPAK